jgi:soluble lytic murein transglycosylase-like protein
MSRARVMAMVAVAVVAASALAGLALVLTRGGGGLLVPRPGVRADPLAFTPGKAAAFERAAAEGLSQVLYAKSPGGVVVAAARTAAYRPLIDRAAAGTGIDPAIVEAIVLLESGGRPDVIAGPDPADAAGLTQILAETGTDFLGMKIDLEQSRLLTAKIAAAARRGDRKAEARLLAARRRIDARFDPAQAIAGTVRYLTTARSTFGRSDLAVVSYHMGIGNLENVLRAYAGAAASASIASLVSSGDLSWARVFFSSSPAGHAAAWRLLGGFGDDSQTYYWRVLAAEQIMRLYRRDPEQLEALAYLHTRAGSAEQVLHPEPVTQRFATPAALLAARSRGTLQPLPDDPATLHYRIGPHLGGLAPELGATAGLYRALRPEALALLLYLAGRVHALAAGAAPLTVTSAVADERYEQLEPGAAAGYSLATTGYSFDILRRYSSAAEAQAFQYELDRLQALDLIAWTRTTTVIHVTVSSRASELVRPLLERG